MIEKYAEVFRDTPRLVCGYEYVFRLQTNEPVFQKPYAIPMARQQAVVEEIERMIEMDIIEQSRSSYSVPIVPVLIKNGDVKLCTEGRKLNNQIILD